MPSKKSAGLLLYRRSGGRLEVLLAHPGGPYWRRRDAGAWSIPKGEIEGSEAEETAARREFAEELGYHPQGECLPLGDAKQPSGKLVTIFALLSDWEPGRLVSSSFEIEWPPRSGCTQQYPEVDRAEWFSLDIARDKILKGQAVFLDRLAELLD
ncbi:NUDIX domain-containing protein [Hyphomicrobium sp. xq]|uniref:NUDIX domain-containing protein n=1 Tax=Hyphomicrobium album TaxID=2665159 RepID=A0A6I3KKW3_9HYPH|nr:NUDIX domain-containing protein [Hyphomicrobium album]MTD95774.1 NUDIX domain-containing protein [Hyphomicrobium album]